MKYKRIIPLLVYICIVSGSVLFFILKTHAQSVNTGLSVHPSNFDLTANPGDTTQQTVYLENLTNQPVAIGVDKKNFSAQGEEGGVNLNDNTSTYSLASWITTSPAAAVIQPHTNQQFTFTVTIPKNAEPGGHFGSLVFKTVPNSQLQGSGALLTQQVASLILLKIPGNTLEKAQVESLTTDKQFYEFGPVNFDLRVKNKSDIHIQPIGLIVVKGWLGQRFEVPIDTRNILPNAIRKIPATLKQQLLIGKYDASLVVSYGSKNQQLYASTSFYAFPIRYGLIALVILLVLFFLRKRLWKAGKAILTGK